MTGVSRDSRVGERPATGSVCPYKSQSGVARYHPCDANVAQMFCAPLAVGETVRLRLYILK